MATQKKPVLQQKRYILASLLMLLLYGGLFSQKDTTATSLSFDFGITRGRNINLWPILKKYKSAEKKELTILFPVYSDRSYYIQRHRHFRILPFFIRDSSLKGVDQRYISTYYPSLIHLRKDSATGKVNSFKFFELAPHISMLGISRSSEGLKVENNMFFFIWYKKDALTGRTRFVVFPVYWYFANRKDTTRLLFPLLYHKKSSSDNHLNIGILFDRRINLTKKSYTLFPIWWHRTVTDGTDTSKKNIIFPVYWRTKTKYSDNTVLFPAFYKIKNENIRSFTLFPFYSRGENNVRGSRYIAVTPLFWKIRSDQNKINILLPFYLGIKQYHKTDTTKTTIVFPLFWSYKSKGEKNSIILPLVFSFKNDLKSSLTVIPLFSCGSDQLKKRNYFSITPFFWHFNRSGNIRNFFFPVYWHTKQTTIADTITRHTVFPLFFLTRSGYENRTVIFPLLFHYKNTWRHSLTIFPLFSYSKRYNNTKKAIGVTPLFWHIKSNTSITDLFIPVYFQRKKYLGSDTVYSKIVFPVVWSFKSKRRQNLAIFPVLLSLKNRHRQSLTVFPLFSYGHRFDSSARHLGITPFFWRIEKQNKLTNIVFPLYWNIKKYYKHDTIYREILFPLIWTYKSKNQDNAVAFPILFKFNNKRSKTLTILPLFSIGQKADSSFSHEVITPFFWHVKTPFFGKTTLFPVYWQTKEYLNGDTTIRSTLFPVYWSLKSETKNYNIIFPLIFKTNDKGKSTFTFFPLFSFGKDNLLNKRHLVVTPLFWKFGSIDRTSQILFPIYWAFNENHGNHIVKRKVFFPLYWSFKSEKKKRTYLLPFVFSVKKENYRSFTFFPLFSFGRSEYTDKKHLVITPLFGKFRNSGKSTAFLFPILTYSKYQDHLHYSVFYFIFRKTKKPGYSKTSILWPVCEYLREPSRKKFRIAPFVWYSKTDSSKLITIQPLFYFYRNNSEKIFMLSWFLYRREVTPGVSVLNSFLWRFYYSKRYFNGDFERRFLHLIVASVKTEEYREKSVFPLYHSIKHSNGDRSYSAGFGFYNRFKEYKPEIDDYYEEENFFWFIRLRSNFKELKAQGKDGFVRKKQKPNKSKNRSSLMPEVD